MSWLGTMVVGAALAAPALPTQAAQAPAELPNAAGPWTPPGTKVSFPERAGEFRRTRIVRYGPDDWSVGYDLIRNDGKVGTTTIYFYAPTELSCPGQFDDAVLALTGAYSGATELSRSIADSPKGRRRGAARNARFRFTTMFNRAQQDVLSDLYIYCHPKSRWTIKYRSTRPASQSHDEAAALVRAIDWPDDVAE